MSKPGRRAADLVWVSLPALARRPSALGGLILSDGAYLRSWPGPALAVPVAAFLTGAVVGRIHPEETFTAALWVMGPMVVAAGLGAALGWWTWLGYVLVDFFLFPHLSFGDQELLGRAGLLATYLLLATLLVVIPVSVRTLVRASTPRVRALAGMRPVVQIVTSGVFNAALVYFWTQAAPILVRPAYTWAGGLPTNEAIQPVQATGWFLVFLAAMVGLARPVLQLAGERALPADAAALPPPRARHPWWVRSIGAAVAQAALTVLLLSGALETWFDAIVAWVALTAVLAGQRLLGSRLSGYVAIVTRVPLVVRLAVAAALSFLLARTVLDLAFQTAGTSFRPIVVAAVLSLVIYAALLPDRVVAPVSPPRRRPA